MTFRFPNSKKNSFRGNYMRKYSNCHANCDWNSIVIVHVFFHQIFSKTFLNIVAKMFPEIFQETFQNRMIFLKSFKYLVLGLDTRQLLYHKKVPPELCKGSKFVFSDVARREIYWKADSKLWIHLFHSAHRTPNFTNPEYFVCLFFQYFFQIKVLISKYTQKCQY